MVSAAIQQRNAERDIFACEFTCGRLQHGGVARGDFEDFECAGLVRRVGNDLPQHFFVETIAAEKIVDPAQRAQRAGHIGRGGGIEIEKFLLMDALDTEPGLSGRKGRQMKAAP